jgi:hypothetical protein
MRRLGLLTVGLLLFVGGLLLVDDRSSGGACGPGVRELRRDSHYIYCDPPGGFDVALILVEHRVHLDRLIIGIGGLVLGVGLAAASLRSQTSAPRTN